MAIPLNQGNFSGLSSLASNVTPNYNFPINGTSPLGSMFGGLAQGIQQNKENDFKQQQLDVSNRYAQIAEQEAALKQQMMPIQMQQQQAELDLTKQRVQMEKTKMEIEAMSKLEESQLNKIRGLGAAGIIRMESAKTPEEQEQAKIDTLNMAVKEGILSEEQAQQFAQLPPQQFHATMTYYYQSATKGAELKEMRAPKEKGTGTGANITYTDSSGGILSINQPASKPTINEQQGAIIDSTNLKDTIYDLKEKYSEKFLGRKERYNKWMSIQEEDNRNVPGVGSALTAINDMTTGMSAKERKQFIAESTKFTTQAEQLFQEFRKQTTGAQASDREIKMLREIFLNPEMSPTEFNAAMDTLLSGAERKESTAKDVLREGVDITPKTYKYKGETWTEEDIAATAKELKISEDEVLRRIGAK